MIRYVATDTTKLFSDSAGRKKRSELLWGDRVQLLTTSGSLLRVKARGAEGYVKKADLGDESLLEVYFIDVGQGDGVLVRFPDDRHVLIDGGYNRAKQQTHKNAADFLYLNFVKDYGRTRIALDAMISSHCDADHYGGLWDLLNVAQEAELDAEGVDVTAFYHAGVSWWSDAGKRNLGPSADGMLTRLLGGKSSLAPALRADANPKLQGEWAEFIECVRKSGCAVKRLSDRTEWVPGFGPADGDARLRVLGPVEPTPNRLHDLGSPSQNTNGNSIVLRLDYGRTRILLTGDLNAAAQKHLLEAYDGRRMEFACDVGKSCHHGSADVSYEFLSVMSPAATVISSGDSEQHAHPRPNIVAASAITGHVRVEKDRLVTPLVYSTEISRSARLATIDAIGLPGLGLPGDSVDGGARGTISYAETSAGALRPKRGTRPLAGTHIVAGMIYGLVNVRTDGEKILCATLNEKENSWDCAGFESRF